MEAGHDSTALALASASAFLLFAGGFWAIASAGQWALAPAERRFAVTRLPLQFSFRDVLLLMLQMQAVVAAAVWWCGAGSAWMHPVVGIAAASTAAMWFHGVARLSRCGVRSPLRRAAFLLVVAPSACAAILAALWINGRAVVELLTAQPSPWGPWLAGNFAVLAGLLLCRMLTMWVTTDAQP